MEAKVKPHTQAEVILNAQEGVEAHKEVEEATPAGSGKRTRVEAENIAHAQAEVMLHAQASVGRHRSR